MRSRLIHRYLDPSETLLEILFGLIMALILTSGARLLGDRTQVDLVGTAVGLIGCNIAWGVIDGVFYLLGVHFNRNRRVQFVRRLQATTDEAQALAVVRDEFDLEGEPEMPEADRAAFHRALLDMLRHSKTGRLGLLRNDFFAAIEIVILVSLTALPGVVPLLLMNDGAAALGVANAVQIFLLFAVGWAWAQHAGAKPWLAGTVIAALGTALVLVAVALGG